jgi:hypothetical protein
VTRRRASPRAMVLADVVANAKVGLVDGQPGVNGGR